MCWVWLDLVCLVWWFGEFQASGSVGCGLLLLRGVGFVGFPGLVCWFPGLVCVGVWLICCVWAFWFWIFGLWVSFRVLGLVCGAEVGDCWLWVGVFWCFWVILVGLLCGVCGVFRCIFGVSLGLRFCVGLI